jgi:hypothetical protein
MMNVRRARRALLVHCKGKCPEGHKNHTFSEDLDFLMIVYQVINLSTNNGNPEAVKILKDLLHCQR